MLEIASRPGTGMEPLFEALRTQVSTVSRVMDVDYPRYGAGEALLGWVNVKATLQSPGKRASLADRDAWLTQVASSIQRALRRRKAEIAHLKLSLVGPDREISAVQVVSSAAQPEVTRSSGVPLRAATLLINLRAEADPDFLLASVRRAATREAERTPSVTVKIVHSEHFRPAQPVPSHRVTKVTP